MNRFGRRQRWLAGAAALGVLGVGLAVFMISRSTSGPGYQGRNLQAWFQRYCRLDAAGGGGVENARMLEAKVAFLEMGTNAVPFLVDEAFTFRRDSLLRTNLHRLFMGLPEWAGRGAFVPYAEINSQATRLLRVLRPPASVLLPMVEPHRADTNVFHQRQAIFVLGLVGDGADAVVPILIGALTNRSDPWMAGIAMQSLHWLGDRASNALPFMLERAARSTANDGLGIRGVEWLARLGPLAASAAPRLEPFLQGTNVSLRISAAVALIQIDPGYREALRVLKEAAESTTSEPMAIGGRRGPRETLYNAISRSPRRPNEPLALLLEPLARAEVAAWGPRGASFRATSALERVDPARAILLYRGGLDQPGALYAAGRLLQLERTNEIAARILIDQVGRQTWRDISPIWWLGEASSSNALAMGGLGKFTTGGLSQPVRGRVADPLEKRAREAALDALARIRYRETRVARGFPESEWE